ncbi:hypothetical protein RVR_4394 [Actinacidiphila reveromycinica]|uniref:Uncharacterized protein n=1 Tax=Actinacidiphila reveromycinica TaxID=659352 RepID=A0A7U3UTD3_9ACTN|nr:hypothetical protein [Streptomyces sp. SN-593]BBA98266.1 hypothetical protein RVR_4394 [Streptomyces sp. SN-593]
MTNHQTPHCSRTCNLCAPLRHPSHFKTRRSLVALLPRQSAPAGTGHENGGGR